MYVALIWDHLIVLRLKQKLEMSIFRLCLIIEKYAGLAVLLVFTSCGRTNSDSVTYDSFPEERYRIAKSILLDTAIFRYPFRVDVRKNKAWIMDLHNADNYYHTFSYPEFDYLGSFGRRGQAAEEMLSAETFSYQSGDFLWALDANKGKLVRWNSLDGWKHAEQEETVSLGKEVIRALDFVVYSDSTFIIPDYSGENRLFWVNRQGEIVKRAGRIPAEEQYPKGARIPLAQAWRSFIDYNPRNGILAMATQLGEVLEIYNLRNDTSIVVKGPFGEPEFARAEGHAIPTGIMGFSDVHVMDRHIYAVFHGRSFKEMMQSNGKPVDGGQYINVYTLKGEPVCRYVLDRFIYGIHVDEDKGIITALDVNSDQPVCQIDL